MKFWKNATDEHIVYEALTAIADERIEFGNGKAKCFSSSRNKFYTIEYDLDSLQFMSDDNMAYYRDEVSYPILAVLLLEKIISYDEKFLPFFKNIPWKDINQKNKNNYLKSVSEFLENLSSKEQEEIVQEINKIFTQLQKLKIGILGEKTLPPQKY